MFKSLLLRVIIFTLSISILASLTTLSPTVSAINESENTSISTTQISETQKLYTYENFTVDYSYSLLWNGDHSVSMAITNTGTEIIENWALLYDLGGTVTGAWGGQVITSDEEISYLNNVGYNANIAPDETVNIGYTVSDISTDFPTNFYFIQERIEREEGYTSTLSLTSFWDTNINCIITINNTSDIDIKAWEFNFASNFTISESFVAGIQIIETPVGYKLKGVDDTVIEAGTSVSLSFSGTVEDSSIVPEISESVLTEVVAITQKEIDYELDTDNDGIPDFYEDYIGTDKNNSDTDGDGLPDGYEVTTLGTDSTLIDTDNNGISDANEDFDSDGLTNLQEYQLGTNPFAIDTDDDGFTDKYEVDNNMNPLVYDEITLNYSFLSNVHSNSIVDLQNMTVETEDLVIEYNDDQTQVTGITGKFSDVIVNSPADALLAIYSVKDLLGIDDPETELRFSKIYKNEYSTMYHFAQIYNGIKVSGVHIGISVDTNGITKYVQSDIIKTSKLYNLSFDIISESECLSLIENYLEENIDINSDIEIYIDNYDYTNYYENPYTIETVEIAPYIIYNVKLKNKKELFEVNAHNGNIRIINPPIFDSDRLSFVEEGYGKDEKGGENFFPTVHECSFYLGLPTIFTENNVLIDFEKNIEIYGKNEKLISSHTKKNI
jgi:hypothetical protein